MSDRTLATILLNRGGHLRGNVPDLREVCHFLPLCFDFPLFPSNGRPAAHPLPNHDEQFRIALWDPSSLGAGGFSIPDNPGDARLLKLLGASGLERMPMRSHGSTGNPLLYAMHAPGTPGLQWVEPYRAAARDLSRIRRLTDQHVWVTLPSMATGSGKAPDPDIYEDPDFIALSNLIHVLGYTLDVGLIPNSLHLGYFDAVVTYSSEVAIQALVSGLPVISLNPDCFARGACPDSLRALGEKRPWTTDAGRDRCLRQLAYTQWSESEIAGGEMLDHYLPKIQEHVSAGPLRPAGRATFRQVVNRKPASIHVEICRRRLFLDLAWESERRIAAWTEKNVGGEGIHMKVWSLSHSVADNDCVLIAGAGIGFSSLLAIGAGAAEVIAFEPDPRHSKRISTLEEEGVQAFPMALGSHGGEGILYFSEQDNQQSTLSLERVAAEPGQYLARTGIRVPVRRLDDLCKDVLFDVMLIDTEGSTLEALAGASELLARGKPRSVIAVLGDGEMDSILAFMKTRYACWARIETSANGWGRLLPAPIANCGQCNPMTLIFFDDPGQFPNGGSWSAPAPPRSVAGVPPGHVDTAVVLRELPIGRFGLLSKTTDRENCSDGF